MKIFDSYDSIEIECPIPRAAEVINMGYDVLDNFPLEAFPFMKLPIGSEGEIGISWGELQHARKGITQSEIEEIVRKIKAKSIVTFGGDIY